MSSRLPIEIFQSSPVGIIIIDTEDLVIQFANSRFELLSGKSNEELVGNHFSNMFSARASELVELRNEVLEPTEITCKGAKDRDVPALFSYSRFEWEGSSYYKIDIIDISQRKALEETLVIYKERLDVAVNGAGIGIWEWDLINDEFFWDRNTYSIYGIERDSLSSVVDAWSSIVVPEDLERVNQEVDFAVERGKPLNTTFRIIHAKTGLEYIEIKASVIQDSSSGAARLVGITHNISNQVLAQKRIEYDVNTLQTFFDLAPIGIARNKMGGEFVEVNDEFERLTGYTKDELNGLSYWDLTPEKYAEQEEIQLKKLETTGAYGPYEKEYINKEGRRVPVLLNGKIVNDANGEKFIWSVVQDLTDRKDMMSKLMISEERQRIALELDELGVWDYDVVKNKLDWDDQSLAMFEINRKDFKNTPEEWVSRIHPDMRAQVLENVNKYTEEGASSFSHTYKIITGKGNERDIRAMATVYRDEHGQVERMIGLNRDITKELESERLLKHFTEKLEKQVRIRTRELAEAQGEANQLVDTLNKACLVVELDRKGGVKTANDNFYEVLGYNAVDIIGEAFVQFMEAPFTAELIQGIEGLRDGKSWVGEVSARKKNGDICYLQVTAVPFKEVNGRVQKFVLAMNDITSIRSLQKDLAKSLEEEKQLNKLKSDFVSMASHQFRTPLSVIQSNSELFNMLVQEKLEEGLGDIVKKADARIQQEVGRLTNMMNDLLLLGKITADAEVESVSVDLVDLCNDLVSVHEKINHHAREIELSVSGNPISINTGLSELKEALDNIIHNALKYSEDNVQVSLDFEKDKVVVEVKDRGVGIPQQDLQHIFEPFKRGTNVNGHRGTGLGLSIAQEAIHKLDGTLTLDSAEGLGTNVKIELPLVHVGSESSK